MKMTVKPTVISALEMIPNSLVLGLKMLWNMKVTDITIVTSALGTIHKELLKGLEDLKIIAYHSIYSIIKIGPNTESSPGDLRRLAVTQDSMKASANAGVKNSHIKVLLLG